MAGIGEIGAGAAFAAVILLPLLALRFAPQLVGHFCGPKAKAVALAAGLVLVVAVIFSFWSDHQAMCSDPSEYRCDISSSLIVVALLWFGLLSLAQIRFAWTTVSAILPNTAREG